MGKNPQFIYTDDEAVFPTSYLQKYFKDEGIQHYITRGHAPFGEVAFKTFKGQLYKRIEADEKRARKNTTDWLHFWNTIDLQKMKHSTIEMTPSEARKPKNEFREKMKIST